MKAIVQRDGTHYLGICRRWVLRHEDARVFAGTGAAKCALRAATRRGRPPVAVYKIVPVEVVPLFEGAKEYTP